MNQNIKQDDLLCEADVKETSCLSSKININGNQAVVLTYVLDGAASGMITRDIYIIRDGKVYYFYTGVGGIPQDESISELVKKAFFIDKIASTFTFTR